MAILALGHVSFCLHYCLAPYRWASSKVTGFWGKLVQSFCGKVVCCNLNICDGQLCDGNDLRDDL